MYNTILCIEEKRYMNKRNEMNINNYCKKYSSILAIKYHNFCDTALTFGFLAMSRNMINNFLTILLDTAFFFNALYTIIYI